MNFFLLFIWKTFFSCIFFIKKKKFTCHASFSRNILSFLFSFYKKLFFVYFFLQKNKIKFISKNSQKKKKIKKCTCQASFSRNILSSSNRAKCSLRKKARLWLRTASWSAVEAEPQNSSPVGSNIYKCLLLKHW